MKENQDYFSEIFAAKNIISGFTKHEVNPESVYTKLGINHFPQIRLKQEHTNQVIQITKTKCNQLLIADALFTTIPNILITIRTADCLPIFIYHPFPLIGLIHAGRVGTQKGITKNSLEKIRESTGLSSGFQFFFGPAICGKCYQIDREKNLYYDLVQENTEQILDSKMAEKNDISYSNFCTLEDSKRFSSYRRGDVEARMHHFLFIKS